MYPHMYPIPHTPLTSGELAHTGVTILPMAIAAVALLLAGLVILGLFGLFARRHR